MSKQDLILLIIFYCGDGLIGLSCTSDNSQLYSQVAFGCGQVMTPVMRCVGNIVCGASDDQLEFLSQNKNLYHVFCALLSSQHPHLRKETLWVLSNITGVSVMCFRRQLIVTSHFNDHMECICVCIGVV